MFFPHNNKNLIRQIAALWQLTDGNFKVFSNLIIIIQVQCIQILWFLFVHGNVLSDRFVAEMARGIWFVLKKLETLWIEWDGDREVVQLITPDIYIKLWFKKEETATSQYRYSTFSGISRHWVKLTRLCVFTIKNVHNARWKKVKQQIIKCVIKSHTIYSQWIWINCHLCSILFFSFTEYSYLVTLSYLFTSRLYIFDSFRCTNLAICDNNNELIKNTELSE